MRVLVRSVGDIGLAIAHRLFREGYAVVIHDAPNPTTTRRGMAFADAVLDGEALLHGVRARRIDDLERIEQALTAHDAISRSSDTRFSWTRGCGSTPSPRPSEHTATSPSRLARNSWLAATPTS